MKNEGSSKRVTLAIFITCAVLFVLLYAIVNIGVISSAVSSVLSVFSPIIIGFGIAYVLNPILRFFEFKVYKKIKRLNVLRALSIVSTYVVAVLLVIGLVYLLVPSIVSTVEEFIGKYDSYIAKTTEIINDLIVKVTSNGNLAEFVNPEQIKQFIVKFFADSGDLIDVITKYVTEYGMKLFVGVKNVAFGIIISIYVLISKEKLQAQFKKLGAAMLSETRSKKIGKYILLTHRTFSNYFMGSIFDCLVVMVLTFIAMLIFGVPYALLIAVIIGVTNIIPILGPIIGAVPSFFIIFIVDPIKAFIFVAIILVIQQIDGNIIAPKIHGDSTGVSSLAVIIIILIMGEYFGILGMLVGVPLFAVIVNIFKEIIDNRLKLKGKVTDTAEYYLKDAVVDPYDHREPIITRLFKATVRLFKSLGVRFFRMIGKPCPWEKDGKNPRENSENTENTENTVNTENNTENDKEGKEDQNG
ncbi:MAG: AI-2E family transporter [Clostridia bacterium]|nr:AI-2E family transporter [Clostridia bacterium]